MINQSFLPLVFLTSASLSAPLIGFFCSFTSTLWFVKAELQSHHLVLLTPFTFAKSHFSKLSSVFGAVSVSQSGLNWNSVCFDTTCHHIFYISSAVVFSLSHHQTSVSLSSTLLHRFTRGHCRFPTLSPNILSGTMWCFIILSQSQTGLQPLPAWSLSTLRPIQMF